MLLFQQPEGSSGGFGFQTPFSTPPKFHSVFYITIDCSDGSNWPFSLSLIVMFKQLLTLTMTNLETLNLLFKIMWAEQRLWGSSRRHDLWPQFVHYFKDLSERLKLLKYVVTLLMHLLVLALQTFSADTLPWIQ